MYGLEDSLEMEIATHSIILAWRIPWTEEPGRLQSMGLQRVEHDLTMKTTTTKYVYIPMYINISMWTHTYTQRIGRMVLICVCSPQKSLMRLVCLHDGGSCSKIQHFRQPHLIGLQTLSGLFIPHLHFLLSWKKKIYITYSGFPVAQIVKNLPAVKETQVRSLAWEDPLEKRMATHSSILAWRIPWIEEPGGLQSMGLQRVGHDWFDLACSHKGAFFTSLFKSSFLSILGH